MPELDLAAELRDLGAHLDVPGDDVALATRVVAAIERSSLRPPAVARRRRRLAAAIAAIAVAAAGGLAAPAVADWVRERIGGVEVRRVPTTVPPSLTTSLDLGRPVSLSQAEDQVPFPIKTLRHAETKPSVWIDDVEGIVVVSLLYPPDVLVQEFAAGLDERTVMTKGAGPGVTVERVKVDGHAGLWVAGGHGIFVGDYENLQFVPSRLAGNSLVWEAGGVTYRLESSLDRAAAVALAGTLG